MENKEYTVKISQNNIQDLNFCYFVLNYLCDFPAEVDDVSEGLSALIETARGKAEQLQLLFYDTVIK